MSLVPDTSAASAKLDSKVRDHPRIAGKTAYILGSGFSRPLEIPVIRDFLPLGLDMLKARAWGDGGTAAESALLEEVWRIADRYRRVLAALAPGMPTIEQLFCLVDLLGESAERESLARFVLTVCELAWQRHTSGAPGTPAPKIGRSHFFGDKFKPTGTSLEVCLYEAFLSQVLNRAVNYTRPRLVRAADPAFDPAYAMNAIVSLNYDLVVERKLADLTGGKIPYYYGRDVVRAAPRRAAKSFLPIVKLHGSLNWKSIPNQPWVKDEGLEAANLRKPDAPFVFPSWQRSSMEGTVFALLVRDARAHLRLASRWVFIGYSMPATDLYFQYLLADALDTPELPRKIEVVDKVSFEVARARLATILGQRGESVGLERENYHDGLDQFVTQERNPHSFPPADS